MPKWADYCISAVKFEDKRVKIIAVDVREDLGETIDAAKRLSRSDVVAALERGHSFCTILKTSEGKWNKGADVHIVVIRGTKYIRTDKNSIEADNLGELPGL